MLEDRQKQLLNLVVENHIVTAEPVGSKFLIGSAGLDLSEATVRNELRALENDGYLMHPHTSAGRIPTEAGYRFYLNSIDFSKTKTPKKDRDLLHSSVENHTEYEKAIKNLAKELAERSGLCVIFAFSPNKVYYTGLANLFNQPEFSEFKLIANVSSMFDRCEECLDKFYDCVDGDLKYYIGQEHPFGYSLSTIAFRVGENSLLSLLGPIRMDYSKNWGLMKEVKEIFKSIIK